MNIRLKHRLVGAAVLVTIGVIFVPMVLDGPPPASEPVVLDPLPPPPERGYVPKRVDLTLPEPPATAPEDPVAEAPSAAPGNATPPAEPPPSPALGDGTAWVIQVGSFRNESNAVALRDKLREMDLAAFNETVTGPDGKPATRVQVGPELDRERLERLRGRLEKELGLAGIIRQHR